MIKKILLIETDESVVSTLQPWLTQCGYNVTLATEGGDQGLLLAVTKSPNLILIDTQLPIIDGWQAIKILKKSTVTNHIPVIALTGPDSSDEEWNKVLASGCNACELKPVDRTSLLSKIKALTEPVDIATSSDHAPTQPNPLLFPNCHASPPETTAKTELSDSSLDSPVSHQAMIAYVDDSPADSEAMAAIIKGAGYGYGSIREPLKALPMLLELKPQLIFLDLVMPFTNGYEMCSQIHRTPTFKKTPIIIVTSNDGIIDRVRARIVGASGFFSKPITKEGVIDVLNKYLEPVSSKSPKSFYRQKLRTLFDLSLK
ncbi:MAG: response regulator [Cyanobacteria bacterium P01_C01_bin.118]